MVAEMPARTIVVGLSKPKAAFDGVMSIRKENGWRAAQL